MTRNSCFVLCFIQALIVVHAAGLYSVIGPGTIRSNSKYNVAVSVQDTESACTIEVGITGPSYNETKNVELQPMATEIVEFSVPKLAGGDYNLTARGLVGITFQNTTKLDYAENKPLIYIQTDKATYKPGDEVKFRVLVLDENTLPAELGDEPLSILINDGEKNRIKQLKDIKPVQGVYADRLQLSEQPVLGQWNLEVYVGDTNLATKSFEVDKYVLPKYEVTVDTAKNVAIADGVIKVTVRAKYTYGKPVKGKATVSLKPEFHYYGSFEDNLQAQKTVDINGKGHADFYFDKDLSITKRHSYLSPLLVTAEVEEELTGNNLNATATVHLHNQRYRIESLEQFYHFHPGKPTAYKVVVKDLDGSPVQDRKSPVKLIVGTDIVRIFGNYQADPTPSDNLPKPMVFESQLDEHGMATFELTLPEEPSYYSVQGLFLDTVSHLPSLSRGWAETEADDHSPLKLTVLTENARLGKDVKVEVKSNKPLKYFVYTVTARGNIVKSERVEVPDNRKAHTIAITPTFEMVPQAIVFVHTTRGKDLQFHEEFINFETEFENSIDISTTAQAKPGEDIELKITTAPDSYVGLLGVDQSVLLLKSGNDFSKDEVMNGLKKINSQTPWMPGYGAYPGRSSGLVTLTNANYPYNHDYRFFRPMFASGVVYQSAVAAQGMPVPAPQFASAAAGPVEEAPRTRKEFPENWIFDDIENGDKNSFTLAKKVPDTITSWVITGFSLNPKTGLALTENPTKIQVFQPFFVSTNLPYSVKRGEVIAIPVLIFNYMEKALDAEVTMDNTDKEYEFTEATNEIEDKPLDEIKRTKRVSIPSNTGTSISFMIRPQQVGTTTLKITAITPLAGDTIHQKLKVEPEGVTQYQNRAYFVNLKDSAEHKETIEIDIPADAVPDSEYIEFSVVGDLLGPTIKNIHELVRMPYGCGEQNMVNFVPNILVLKYLQTIKRQLPSVTEKAKKYLEIGYQRELTYKHDDGSYSAFGKSDKQGSTWLTAYVARSFHQAADYTDIDPRVLTEALDYLASKQADNGSFPEYGKLFDFSHQNELGLTAFVLLAFLENVESLPKYENVVAKGMQYLKENVDADDDQYSLSIAAAALQKAESPVAEKILAKLQTLAKNKNDRRWWSKEEEKPSSEVKPWFKRSHSNDIEITSYVLLALLEKEDASTVLPIIKWLIAQRNSNGGFSSTQDTVIGLQALIKFAEKTGSGNGETDIDFVATGQAADKGSIKVNAENSLVLQTHVLPKSTRKVEVTARGTGSSMVQLSYRFNLVDKEQKPSFRIKAQVKDSTPPQMLSLDVCAEFVALNDGDRQQSNMAVMEIALPSGFTADTDSFAKIQEVDVVKRTETKHSDSTVIVYFDGLTAGDVKCIPIEASKTHAVAKQKPAPVVIYDYYEPGRKATEFYEIKSSLCDICENEDCGAGCKKD